MRIEELIGQRIRERREELEMSQAELGRLLGRLLDKEWSRQTVSAAEQGKRAFTSAEMVAISHVLRTTVSQLFTPPAKVTEITMPSGAVFPAHMVFAGEGTPREDWNLAAIWETIDHLKASTTQSRDLAQDIEALITQRVAGGGVVRMPYAEGYGPEDTEPVKQRQPIVAAIVTSDRGVLVGKRNDGKPPWTFIAGEQEPGERPEDTAIREVKEETTLRIQAGDVIGEREHPKTGRTMIYLAATPTHGTEIHVGDEDELAEVRWVSLAAADELLPGMFEPVREHLARELGEG